MTTREIVEKFEAGSPPGDSFHHADHVQVGFAYLSEFSVLEAIGKFSAALKHFAVKCGKPNLYHETITWAYLFLIRERMARAGREQSWEEFAENNADLLIWNGGVIQRMYGKEILTSEIARAVFVLPVIPSRPQPEGRTAEESAVAYKTAYPSLRSR